MRVVIISGEKQGQNIADRLLAKDEYHMMFRAAEHRVTFIEEDEVIDRTRFFDIFVKRNSASVSYLMNS